MGGPRHQSLLFGTSLSSVTLALGPADVFAAALSLAAGSCRDLVLAGVHDSSPHPRVSESESRPREIRKHPFCCHFQESELEWTDTSERKHLLGLKKWYPTHRQTQELSLPTGTSPAERAGYLPALPEPDGGLGQQEAGKPRAER